MQFSASNFRMNLSALAGQRIAPLAAPTRPPVVRCVRGCRLTQTVRLLPVSAGGNEPGPSGRDVEDSTETGEEAAAQRSPYVSLPRRAVPTVGAVFFLAGALKLLIMCFPMSPMAVTMFLRGRAELGLVAALKMVPLALGTAWLAKRILDQGLHRRCVPRVCVMVVVVCMCVCVGGGGDGIQSSTQRRCDVPSLRPPPAPQALGAARHPGRRGAGAGAQPSGIRAAQAQPTGPSDPGGVKSWGRERECVQMFEV